MSVRLGTKVIFFQSEVIHIAHSEGMKKLLGHEALKIKREAQSKARVKTGRLRRRIGYTVAQDSYGAYANVFTDARNKGFRYGAYWNALEHYLDDSVH